MKLDFNWIVGFIGGLFVISSWIIYHFFDAPLIELVKLMGIGLLMILVSLWLDHKVRLLKI